MWERLRDTLDDDDVLLANLRLTDGTRTTRPTSSCSCPTSACSCWRSRAAASRVEPDDADGHRWWTQSEGGHRQDQPGRPGARHQARAEALRRAAPARRDHQPGGVGTRGGHAVLAVRRRLQRPRAAALVAPRQGRPAGARGAGPRRRVVDAARRPTAHPRRRRGAHRHPDRAVRHALRRQRRVRRPRGRVRPAHHGAGHDPPRDPPADRGSRCAVVPAAARPCSPSSRPRS